MELGEIKFQEGASEDGVEGYFLILSPLSALFSSNNVLTFK
jgi:hypothetical protein